MSSRPTKFLSVSGPIPVQFVKDRPIVARRRAPDEDQVEDQWDRHHERQDELVAARQEGEPPAAASPEGRGEGPPAVGNVAV